MGGSWLGEGCQDGRFHWVGGARIAGFISDGARLAGSVVGRCQDGGVGWVMGARLAGQAEGGVPGWQAGLGEGCQVGGLPRLIGVRLAGFFVRERISRGGERIGKMSKTG